MTEEQIQQIEQLYLEMYDILYYRAQTVLRSDALAEEAVQETFRIACGKPEELLCSAKPQGWLVNTMKHLLCNMQRRQIRTQEVVRAAEVQFLKPFEEVLDHLTLDLLYGKLADTDGFRLLMELSEGRSVREMAASRGISESSCKKRIQRAKMSLKKEIEKY